MAFADQLKNLVINNASTFQGDTSGDATDSTDTSTATDPYANLTKNDVLQEYYKISGNTPTVPISNPVSGLTGADYYPTENNSPEKLQEINVGGKFGQLGVITGGAPLYPFAVRQARRDAINNATYQQALMYQNKLSQVSKKYQKQGTYAPYQQQLNDQINGIQDDMQDYIKQNGMRGINELSDPDSDISQKLDDRYYKSVAQAKSLDDAATYATWLQKEQAQGKYISPSTQQTLADFREGDFNLEDMPKVMGKMSAYANFDSLFGKDSPLLNTDDIQATVVQLKDANGKPLAATDKEKAIGLVTRQVVTDDAVNKRLKYIRDNYPQYNEISDATIKDYIKTNAKGEVKETVEKMENFEGKKDETVEPQTGTTVNIATKLDANGQPIPGDPSVQTFKPHRSWDLSKTNNAPKNVTIKNPSVVYNIQTGKQERGQSGSATVDIVSVDEFALTNGTNKIASDEMYETNPNAFHLQKMALVVEPQPKDEETKTQPPPKQYYVPYDAVAQQLKNSKINLTGIDDTGSPNYSNVQSLQDNNGNTIQAGVKNGKWFNIATGQPIQQ